MGIKVKDIANILNVSSATVSLVLNNKPGVGLETRQKVLKKIKELGYDTNYLSKPALKNNKNLKFLIYKKHGKVVGDTPFFSTLIEGIDIESRMNGCNLNINYITNSENAMEILRIIEENPPDGIILLATEMNWEDLKLFLSLEIPIVILDSYFDRANLDSIIINNEQGAYEATKYLIKKGHKVIGYLHSSVFINNFDERKEGFYKALKRYEIKSDNKYVLSLESTFDGAYNDMKKLIQAGILLPTAFFADNDIIASGAMKAMREEGIKVPEDISIVGFDDMSFCEMIDPPLTTIKVYEQRLGILAVKRLIEKIEGNAPEFIKIEIGTEIVERKSVSEIFNKRF